MKFTGERMVLGETDIELEIEHLNRYYFAAQFTDGKHVLDAACGTGYGSAVLAHNAERVDGIDISEESIHYADQRYGADNISFQQASVESIPYPESTFDVVVSFETLEHVDELMQGRFLREIRRVLKPDGLLIMSTPNHEIYSKRGTNEFHVKELSNTEFRCLLEARFRHVQMFSQQREVCDVIIGSDSGAAASRNGLPIEQAEYMIAVCSNEQLAPVLSQITVRNDKRLEKLTAWAMENHVRNEKNNAYISELNAKLEQCESELKDKAGHVELLLQNERNMQAELSAIKEEQVKACQYIAETKDAEYRQLAAEKEAAYRNLAETKDAEYRQLAAEKDAAYRNLAERKNAEFRHMVELKDAEYQELEEETSQKYQELMELSAAKEAQWQQTLRNKEGHIAQLLEPERELERIKSSRSWRFMGYVWKIRDVLVPRGSRRRLFGKALIKLIKHPVRFLSKFTPKRIGKFFRYLRTEGVEGVSRRMDDCLVGTDIRAQAIELVPVDSSEKKTAADYTAFSVPQWERPAVSIVIPVYNEFDYTYHCIYSVVENSGEVSYEIIVADDCSTDLTKEIQQIISGLVVVRNQENLRFLRNCNHAAKQARGQYILFLNNDTQVQPNWLAPLVELIERDSRIGLVGSKLVYPDGRLQEAGGILWRDGSAWNYGNRSDPALPEYNYVKEADYISGASIMIRRALWEEIGGFDERFAPAYCEDSDLAFTVRKLGYKVMYQPLSVVVHFEGISNGTDTSSGQKAYQVANQKKLIQKWCEVLEQEHFENSKEVFRARDRSAGKKTLLMVDHYVPMYDKDAGSRTVFQYLKLFTDHGYHVKFIGDNFCAHEPYTQTLQQMGVEVLYGPYYAKHWSDWLAENGTHIDYVFLNRPHISVKYIDKVRQKTSAKIIYYGHDLHFLREQREYELTGDSSLLKSAEEWKQKELTLMQKADVSYYPSYVEVQEIQRLDASLFVRAIPAYLFDKAEPVTFDVTRRRGMMFIGGFVHRPNVDAVKWLAQELMPELRRRLPGVTVHILGSNPPEEVTALAGEDFHVEGFVTDEQLTEFYHSCRIAIVPLRYGAGIKGKVVEAMRCGVPVVTTSVGAEGIAGAENVLRIADSPSEFAQAAAELYRDNKALVKMSKTEQLYVRDHFSPENAVAIIGSDFDMEA